ncbi:uncharacterized protein METZ01_LOCUS45628, partial [marine metagenome]
MDNNPRLFIKAGLIYGLLSVAFAVSIANILSISVRVRFVRIHINLFGF